jgi:hypothetical protein
MSKKFVSSILSPLASLIDFSKSVAKQLIKPLQRNYTPYYKKRQENKNLHNKSLAHIFQGFLLPDK